MDDSVLRGMARWPNVPELYGWLLRDHRGSFLLKGQPITHPLSLRFLKRHYLADERGCYYFQNGPQRVFVELETSPRVYQIQGEDLVSDHGAISRLQGLYMDQEERIFILADDKPGHLDDRDLINFVDHLVDLNGDPLDENSLEATFANRAPLTNLSCHFTYKGDFFNIIHEETANLPERLGFVRKPQKAP